MKLKHAVALAGTSLLAISVPAHAQDAQDDAAEKSSDIVVTGSLIRGIAPAGTNVVSVSQAAVQATGATTVSQLLQTIPQMGSFNDLQRQVGGNNFVTTNRPNLRDLPGFTTKANSATLMLVDGHRVVGMGVSVTSPDVDIVPPGIIERVEVVPDGGSAIYGSDAVAGVINFITRKDFKGIEADARYGFGEKNYHTFDANLTVGHSWDTGNIFASYNYAENSTFFGRDRDYVRMYPVNVTGASIPYTSIECRGGTVLNRRVENNGVLIPTGTNDIFALPYATNAGVAGTANQCDQSDSASVYPENRRHSAFAGLTQQLSDAIKFDVRAFYTNRKTYQSLGDFRGTVNIGANNAALTPIQSMSTYFPVASPSFFQIHAVSLAWGPDQGNNQRISLSTWGVTPSFTIDMGSSWQARVLASYGESTTEQHTTAVNATALSNAIRSNPTLFNPYNMSLTNPAALAAVTNWESFGKTRQRQFNARVILDGDLLTLPGGAVKLAVGAEYLSEGVVTQRGTTVPGYQNSGYGGLSINGSPVIQAVDPIPIGRASRNVKSLFGELVVPLFSDENAAPDLQELTLSLSGRYDHYSDFGNTFNPKVGLTWRPASFIKFRGAWGKSFAAPSLMNSPTTDPVNLSWMSGSTFSFLVPCTELQKNNITCPTSANSNGIVLLGSRPGIQPEKAQTWSLGADIDPLPGLKLSLTYWNIKYRDVITQAPFTNFPVYFSTFRNVSYFINDGSQAFTDRIAAALAAATNTPTGACGPQPSCVFIIEDNRVTNLGKFHNDGLDFVASYRTETGFGGVDLTVNGNYVLHRTQSATANSALVDILTGATSRFRLRTILGANIGNLRAQATWSHTQGYDLSAPVAAAGGFPAQTRVDSYNVVDLFFKYDVPGEGAFKNLAFTLNVNNLFSQDPPVYRLQNITAGSNGFTNGATVGRLVQVGVSKRF
jgi:iron complex outermembrane receptor protein